MHTVIIDSGLSQEIVSTVVDGITICKQGETFAVQNVFDDVVGHGTVVVQLFLEHISENDKLDLHIVKLESDTVNGYDMEALLYALDYIKDHLLCDMLVICSGLRVYNHELYQKLKKIHEQGTIIFSAFDNEGSMSVPAEFDCVVGVDVSDDCGLDDHSFIGLIHNPINIIMKKRNYRVRWINRKMNIVSGASFACAEMAGIFAGYFMKNSDGTILECYNKFLSDFAVQLIENVRHQNTKDSLEHIHKAVVFPFNKEIHAIALNEDLLNFEVIGYYDRKESGKVNIEIGKLLQFSDKKDTIKNIDSLDWGSDFDTFILGHCDTYGRILSANIKEELVRKCKAHSKFLVSLDNLEDYADIAGDYYYPHVDQSEVPNYHLGKMYLSNTPVLGVFGTSAKQGKYTLQLSLRRQFLKEGYAVGQIGTEPTARLFGMDYAFPMGYNSTVQTRSYDSIILLNEYMRGCGGKDPDIIIVGSQSGTCPYHVMNLKLFTLPQIEFLLGTQPDVVVLCLNVNDEIDYVRRTVYTIEGVVDCKVIAFTLYPRRVSAKIEMISSLATDQDSKEYREKLNTEFDIPIFTFDPEDQQALCKYIIDYLS